MLTLSIYYQDVTQTMAWQTVHKDEEENYHCMYIELIDAILVRSNNKTFMTLCVYFTNIVIILIRVCVLVIHVCTGIKDYTFQILWYISMVYNAMGECFQHYS